MDDHLADPTQQRLAAYFAQIGELLGDDERRASFATYAVGLLSEGERKSMEPIAARACPDEKAVDAAHQRLHHIIANSPWSDRDVRRASARYALKEMQAREPVVAWILDDTGFLKQGTHSVGVQRQYTGSAGKVTNCQIGVSLGLATQSHQLPVDFELYLPRSWTDSPAKRREGKIPDEIPFRTKPELALVMLRRAVEDGLPRGIVLGDTSYGNSSPFRKAVHDELGFDYAFAVDSTTKVWRMDRLQRRRGEALSVKDLAEQIGKRGFRRVTWREGTSRHLSARFAFRRVVPYHDDGVDPAVREDVWLIIEWEDSESRPTKFYFATMPEKITRKRLVRIIKLRWRTERMYEDLKGQLGLDHFEGRSYRGWNHHVSAVLCCYAFVSAEHARAFPPSTRKTAQTHAQPRPTRAPLRGLIHHRPHRHRALPRELAASLPHVSPAHVACDGKHLQKARNRWLTQ